MPVPNKPVTVEVFGAKLSTEHLFVCSRTTPLFFTIIYQYSSIEIENKLK
jgi:hypothetical protein